MNENSSTVKDKEAGQVSTNGLIFNEPVIFDMGSPGRKAYSLPECDVPEEVEIEALLPPDEIRGPIDDFPELSELDVVRHFTRLSQWNFSIDTNFYPLGSCTMKYNPKINENMARLPGFSQHHPYTPEAFSQGSLQLLFDQPYDGRYQLGRVNLTVLDGHLRGHDSPHRRRGRLPMAIDPGRLWRKNRSEFKPVGLGTQAISVAASVDTDSKRQFLPGAATRVAPGQIAPL